MNKSIVGHTWDEPAELRRVYSAARAYCYAAARGTRAAQNEALADLIRLVERVDAHDLDAVSAEADDARRADSAEAERLARYDQALSLVRASLDYARNLK